MVEGTTTKKEYIYRRWLQYRMGAHSVKVFKYFTVIFMALEQTISLLLYVNLNVNHLEQ